MACNPEPPPAQEKYLKLTEEPDERGIWWLDERVRRQMEASLDMDPQHLTFTVYQARPLRLTRAEVRQSAPMLSTFCAVKCRNWIAATNRFW